MILLTAFGISFSLLVPVFFSSSLYLVYALDLFCCNLWPLLKRQGPCLNQPRERTKDRAWDLCKCVSFALIEPEEPKIRLAQCRVTLIYILVDIGSLFPNLPTTSGCAAHWSDAILQVRQQIERGVRDPFKNVSFVLICPVEPKIQ